LFHVAWRFNLDQLPNGFYDLGLLLFEVAKLLADTGNAHRVFADLFWIAEP
jgi:hypothetical protein